MSKDKDNVTPFWKKGEAGLSSFLMNFEYDDGKIFSAVGKYHPLTNNLEVDFTNTDGSPLELSDTQADELTLLFRTLTQAFQTAKSDGNEEQTYTVLRKKEEE